MNVQVNIMWGAVERLDSMIDLEVVRWLRDGNVCMVCVHQ